MKIIREERKKYIQPTHTPTTTTTTTTPPPPLPQTYGQTFFFFSI
jgi:hypothetical protein